MSGPCPYVAKTIVSAVLVREAYNSVEFHRCPFLGRCKGMQ